MNRWIDSAVNKFYGAMIGSTVVTFGIVALWVALTEDRQPPWLNVAFVTTWIISIIMTVPILEYAKRRDAGTEPTWGEAMLGATYVFALLFWIYGVVPHQWLTFADAELNWRADRLLIGPRLPWDDSQGLFGWIVPFDITYRVIRDIFAVVIYGLGLGGNIALWSIWQKRGQEAPTTDVEASRYGRPVVRREKVTEGAGV